VAVAPFEGLLRQRRGGESAGGGQGQQATAGEAGTANAHVLSPDRLLMKFDAPACIWAQLKFKSMGKQSNSLMVFDGFS
jgi:hypothetical protein